MLRETEDGVCDGLASDGQVPLVGGLTAKGVTGVCPSARSSLEELFGRGRA